MPATIQTPARRATALEMHVWCWTSSLGHGSQRACVPKFVYLCGRVRVRVWLMEGAGKGRRPILLRAGASYLLSLLFRGMVRMQRLQLLCRVSKIMVCSCAGVELGHSLSCRTWVSA